MRKQYDELSEDKKTRRYDEAFDFVFGQLHDKRMVKWIDSHVSSPYRHLKGTTCSDNFVENVALELCGDDPTYANYRAAVGRAIHDYAENGPDEA